MKASRAKLASVFLFSVSAAALVSPAHAQHQAPVQGTSKPNAAGDPKAPEATAGPVASSQEIVITAQKKSQRLLDVPMSVTSVNSDDLIRQNLPQLQDFYTRVPSLQLSGAPGFTSGASNIAIRGIPTGGGYVNPTVAILIDDVPFGPTTVAGEAPIPDMDPATLQAIEILRGPQGTLYGASSLGGLIKYDVKDPNTRNWSGYVNVGGSFVDGGSFGWNARGGINIPIVKDKLALMVDGFYRDDPSWIDNISPLVSKKNVNTWKSWGGLGKLLYHATDNLTVTLSAMRQHTDELERGAGTNIRVCPECQADVTAPTNFTPLFGDLTINQAKSPQNYTIQLYTGKIDYDLGWAKLTSITGYSKTDFTTVSDATNVFGFLLIPELYNVPGGTTTISDNGTTKKWTEEVRLASTGPRFDWLVGAFYTHEREGNHQVINIYDSSGKLTNAAVYNGGINVKYDEEAVFADLTYHVMPKFDVQVGARYAHNKQDAVLSATIDAIAAEAFGPGSSSESKSNEDAFTWLVSPTYHFTPDLMGYVRVASGYRPGGPNTPLPNIPTTYSSDRVVSYEAGLKGFISPDHLLSLDLALFQIDWSKIQLAETDPVTQFSYFDNGKSARSRGIEITGQWRPWNGFVIDGNAAFTDAVLTHDLPAPSANATPLEGHNGDRLPFTAKVTANIGVQQNFEVSDRVTAYIGANYSYIGDRLSEFRTNSPDAPRPRFALPAYSVTDLRAGFSYDGYWTFDAYVRNLFDKRGVLSATNRNGTSSPTAVFIQPRTFGATIGRRF